MLAKQSLLISTAKEMTAEKLNGEMPEECPRKAAGERFSEELKLESYLVLLGSGKSGVQMGMAAEDWQGRGMEQAASLAHPRNRRCSWLGR